MELLQRRKFCREFLNGYNEKLHPQIVSRVFEIGLLTLKNTFNKLLFSKEELDEIIKSLSGKEYVDIVPLPPRKKLEKLPNKELEEKLNSDCNKCIQTKEEIERKKILKNQQMHRHFLQNPNFSTQNNEIYPFWWWNNKEENINEMDKNGINNNINLTSEEIYNENNEYYNNNYIEENNGNINDIDDLNVERKNEKMENKMNDYSMKKLNSNTLFQQRRENPLKARNLKNNKIDNQNLKIQNKQRVKSSKISQRKNNIDNKNIKKINNNKNKPSQNRKNLNLQKIPKFKYLYNNGRIVKVKEINNDIDKMNLTEPNNKY